MKKIKKKKIKHKESLGRPVAFSYIRFIIVNNETFHKKKEGLTFRDASYKEKKKCTVSATLCLIPLLIVLYPSMKQSFTRPIHSKKIEQHTKTDTQLEGRQKCNYSNNTELAAFNSFHLLLLIFFIYLINLISYNKSKIKKKKKKRFHQTVKINFFF